MNDATLIPDAPADAACSPKVKMPAAVARPVAERIREALAPACERVEVAGSLRRGKETVGDVEIVCLPVCDTDLFGDPLSTSAPLDRALAALMREGVIVRDTVLRRNGNRYKRFVVPSLAGAGLDLFIAEAGNWGNILAIRTGPADFSSAVLKKRSWGGYLPDDLKQEGGYLWRQAGGGSRRSERLDCPTEEAFFAAVGVPWVTPGDRDVETLTRMTTGGVVSIVAEMIAG